MIRLVIASPVVKSAGCLRLSGPEKTKMAAPALDGRPSQRPAKPEVGKPAHSTWAYHEPDFVLEWGGIKHTVERPFNTPYAAPKSFQMRKAPAIVEIED